MMSPLSRRSILKALASAGLAGAGLTLPAQAQSFPQGFSSFSVDVSVLKAKGLGPYADFVGEVALDELRRSFADRVDPRGPRLVVRLTSVILSPFPGGGGGSRWRGGDGGGDDTVEGEALAVGGRGEIFAQHPMLAALSARAPSVAPNEQGRTVAVTQHWVRWLRRQI
ncbi:twin-arginine translocation signal domain-containing protein [Microvirga terrestris]|uniref:Twin-arginine translocation signal domain-containing protein n=1 Tax=Microvirga terrestris TaxID=2791024 RepID=A0ABS0HLW6_9HYPH|nr:twin-arginine translocation signal domain-containing protein [Microvirga terrestris]MBF9194472.1 twin-arginine translocation signal domain-containing protein [Microvirga terrestris]